MDSNIARIQIPPSRVNKKTGTLAVWDIPAKKVRQVFPVDAREMIACGTATLDVPEEHAEEAVQDESTDQPEVLPTTALMPKRRGQQTG